MVPTVEERVFLVEHYIKNASSRECQIAFKTRFGVVWNLRIQWYGNWWSSSEKQAAWKLKSTCAQPSVVTPEKVDEVRERMEARPKKSLRRLAQQDHCSYSYARKAVKTLKLYPYNIDAVHQLLEPGKEKRVADCEWLQRMGLVFRKSWCFVDCKSAKNYWPNFLLRNIKLRTLHQT